MKKKSLKNKKKSKKNLEIFLKKNRKQIQGKFRY